VSPQVISPPRTGDAGLISGSNRWPAAGVVLMIGSLLAAGAIVRKRA
jgi:hypothetical protein